ncbi:unnamed protein product [Caenorhabditis nigoni]
MSRTEIYGNTDTLSQLPHQILSLFVLLAWGRVALNPRSTPRSECPDDLESPDDSSKKKQRKTTKAEVGFKIVDDWRQRNPDLDSEDSEDSEQSKHWEDDMPQLQPELPHDLYRLLTESYFGNAVRIWMDHWNFPMDGLDRNGTAGCGSIGLAEEMEFDGFGSAGGAEDSDGLDDVGPDRVLVEELGAAQLHPHLQLQENGQEHHQNLQNQQHRQMNQMHQRDNQLQLQLQQNDEHKRMSTRTQRTRRTGRIWRTKFRRSFNPKSLMASTVS